MKISTLFDVARRTLEARIRKSFGLTPRPYKLLLELTGLCNSRCTHCGIWKNDRETVQSELRIEEIDRSLAQMGRDLVWLALSGGEVTIYKNFPELVESIRKNCPNLSLVTFTTNGLLPKKALEYAQILNSLGTDLFITVSLDGDAETHDQIRGRPGNYALAQETFHLLKMANIPVHFGVTLSDANAPFIERDYASFAKEMKAVTFVHSDGIYGQKNPMSDAILSRSLKTVSKHYRIRTPGEFLEKVYLELGLIFLKEGRSTNVISCEVLHTSLHVRPNGAVHPCMFLPELGNLRVQSYQEILRSERTTSALETIAKDRCSHCWMNCYAPHSMLMHPIQAMHRLLGSRIKERFENHPAVSSENSRIHNGHPSQL